MTVSVWGGALRWAAIGGCLVLAALGGCGGGAGGRPFAGATESLAAVVGPLPQDLEVLFQEARGGVASVWIVRNPKGWRPHDSAEHRHATLPVDTFMNLVAATGRGTVDPGRPAEQACRYTEWRPDEVPDGSRRLVRIYQLNTDQGEVTVLETLPDPAAG